MLTKLPNDPTVAIATDKVTANDGYIDHDEPAIDHATHLATEDNVHWIV